MVRVLDDTNMKLRLQRQRALVIWVLVLGKERGGGGR